MDNNELREVLAEVSHEIWAHWMKYLFTKCTNEEDGLGLVISWDDASRWFRQVGTPYNQLYSTEKDSDREQADKILAVLKNAGIIE